VKPDELKKWRKENGYTQGELAAVLGVALFSVSRWETGLRSIPSFLHLALKAIPKKGSIIKLKRSNSKRRGRRTLMITPGLII